MANNATPQELFLRVSDESEPVPDLVPVSRTEPLPVQVVSGITFGKMFGNSAANTAYTLTVPPDDRGRQLSSATAVYSSAPTETGVTFILTPAAGTPFATTLSTAAANTQNNPYVPGAPLYVLPGDKFAVTCPAGGSGITAYVNISWVWINP